jgi:polyisoprenoid-binding protein YceI
LTTWKIDPAHSSIEFAAKYMMLTNVKGRFKTFSGEVTAKDENPQTAVANVTIETASVDSGSDQRDGHLRSPDFFDVENYPTITFKSKKVDPAGDQQYKVIGDLTIHGVTREVVLDVSIEGKAKDMRGNERYSLTLQTSISRKDFGLNWNVALEAGGWLVSDQIKINIDAQVVEPAPVTAESAQAAQ